MSDQDNIKAGQQPSTDDDSSKVEEAADRSAEVQVSRRRALIAGLAAAPVIVTLMNRSAFGGTACASQALISSYNNTKQSGATAIASFTTRHKNVKYNTTTGELECS